MPSLPIYFCDDIHDRYLSSLISVLMLYLQHEHSEPCIYLAHSLVPYHSLLTFAFIAAIPSFVFLCTKYSTVI